MASRPDAPLPVDLERELTRLLRRARVTSGAIASEVHPDLDSSSYTVLITLLDLQNVLPGGVRAADVSEQLQLHKSTMSRNITVLERLGLLERIPSPEDARARLLHITPTGQHQLTTAIAARRARIAHALDTWSGEDTDHLARLLRRLNDDLE